MIVKTVRDREKGQDGKLKNEKTDGLGGPSVFAYTMRQPTRLEIFYCT